MSDTQNSFDIPVRDPEFWTKQINEQNVSCYRPGFLFYGRILHYDFESGFNPAHDAWIFDIQVEANRVERYRCRPKGDFKNTTYMFDLVQPESWHDCKVKTGEVIVRFGFPPKDRYHYGIQALYGSMEDALADRPFA